MLFLPRSLKIFLNMKKFLFSFLILTIILVTKTFAQKEIEVSKAVEALRTAMVNADSIALDKLTSADLTYGHSSAKIETKPEYIHAIVSGQNDFISIDLSDQSMKIFDNTATVRHTFSVSLTDSGKPVTVKILVLLVWQKHHGEWKLIARQAAKPPVQN